MHLRVATLTVLIALAVLALGGGTASAQATELTLVSNTDQSDDSEVNIGQDRAMAVRTGPSAGGYWLSSVELDMVIGNPSGTYPTYTVKIHSHDNTNTGTGIVLTGAELTTLINPDSLSTGVNSFKASTPIRLDPDTWYIIAFRVADGSGGNINARLRTTNATDQTGEAGWQINDGYWHKARSDAEWASDTTQTPRFQVKGYTDTTPPVVQSAAVEFGTLRITFDEPLNGNSVPPADQFEVRVTPGSSGSAFDAINVSRVGISGSTVTLTLAESVPPGVNSTVSYHPFPGTAPLKDIPGNEVAQFVGQRVTNNTMAFEEGVIYEAVGGKYRVYRDDEAHCYVESLTHPTIGQFWVRSPSYGQDAEACRLAEWNAYRLSIGEEGLPRDGDLPDGRPPALTDFTCPGGWEASTGYGQQWCSPRNSEMEALSPERAREFVRRGLRPSDETSTNQSRSLAWWFFMSGPTLCGEGQELAFSNGGNGASACTPVSELVSCTSGNLQGVSGRLCSAPVQNDYVDLDIQGRASPTARDNSTVSYSNSDPNDRSTQEYGAPGCWGSEWNEEKGGWVCTHRTQEPPQARRH